MSASSVTQLKSAIRIGVVDDDVSVGKALARLLRGHGYECIVFESAEAALEAPGSLRMHCLIVDIQMGGMNGFEFCERLRAAGVYIPHIFITAYIDTERPDMPDRLSDEILLIKPIDERELLLSIERVMSGFSKNQSAI